MAMSKGNEIWKTGWLCAACSVLFYIPPTGAEGQTGGVGENAAGSMNEMPALEAQLVETLEKNGTKGFYVISDIRPVGAGSLRGKVCIAGRGSLPTARDTGERPGKDILLEWIYPQQQGARLNMLKTKAGVIFQHADVDYSSIQAAGAVWQTIPRLFDREKFEPLCGVELTEGLHLGALYEGDGNLMFDYVRAGEQVVLFPAGTAGSIHRFVGEVAIGRYVFAGENDPLNPLTFFLTKDGYVYLRGKGTVTLPGGEKVQMSNIAPQVRLKTVLEPVARHFPDGRAAVASGPAPQPLGPEVINDLATLKLLCVVVRLDRLGLLTAALSPQVRKTIADRLIELHARYRITSTTPIHSDVDTWGCRPGPAGPTLFVEMKKACEIIHVETEGWPLVRWGGGTMKMNLQSLAVSFDAGAEARVGRSPYRYLNGVWCATSAR